MRRIHLFEFGDQPWVPAPLREAITSLLQLVLSKTNYYAAIIPQLAETLRDTRSVEVVDLCAGGGGPWLRLHRQLGEVAPQRVLFTDKYPSTDASRRLSPEEKTTFSYEARSVDATSVPSDLPRFRTLFTALHHFEPEQARAILDDAACNGIPIAIFEFTERSIPALVGMAFTPLAVAVAVPFLRPFRWSNWVFTYLVPIIPIIATFDGFVSCLRTYSPDELEALVATLVKQEGYEWRIGQARSWRSLIPVTYIIGHASPR